jgi:hypothetical protein
VLKAKVEVTSTDLAVWALFFDALTCIDEVNTIVVVFINASSNSQDVWIKDDVLWWKLKLINKYIIAPLTYTYFTLLISCLLLLICTCVSAKMH